MLISYTTRKGCIRAGFLFFGIALIFVSLSKWAPAPGSLETHPQPIDPEPSPNPSKGVPLPPIITKKYKTCSLVFPTVNLMTSNNSKVIDSSEAVFRVLFTNPEYVKGGTAGTKTTYIFADDGTCHRGGYQEHWRTLENVNVFCIALFKKEADLKPNQVLLSTEFLDSVRDWMKEVGYTDVDSLFNSLHDIPRPHVVQNVDTDYHTFPLLIPSMLMVTSQACDEVRVVGFVPFLPTSVHSFTPSVIDIMDITHSVELESYHWITDHPKFKLIEDSVGRCLWNCRTISNYNSSTGVCSARYGTPLLPVLHFLSQPEDQFIAQDYFEDCALVGGSPSLYYVNLGRDIDNHQVVVRMNYMVGEEIFVSGKFKEHLGTAVTHWFINNLLVTSELEVMEDLPSKTNSTPSFAMVTNQTYALMLNQSLTNSYFKDIIYATPKNRLAVTPNPAKQFSGGQSSTWGLVSTLIPHCKKLTFYGYGDAGNILQFESFITANLYMYQLARINPTKFEMKGDPKELCSLGCYWQYLKGVVC